MCLSLWPCLWSNTLSNSHCVIEPVLSAGQSHQSFSDGQSSNVLYANCFLLNMLHQSGLIMALFLHSALFQQTRLSGWERERDGKQRWRVAPYAEQNTNTSEDVQCIKSAVRVLCSAVLCVASEKLLCNNQCRIILNWTFFVSFLPSDLSLGWKLALNAPLSGREIV